MALSISPAGIAVRAQDAAKPAVRVAAVLVVEPEVDTALGIEVSPGEQIPPRSFLRIRGLPQAAKLSDGHVISPGVWAVPLTALGTLRMRAPLASSGRAELSLALVTVDGGVISETRTSLVVAPAWLLATQNQQGALPPQAAVAPPAAAPSPPPAQATAPPPAAPPSFAALPPPAVKAAPKVERAPPPPTPPPAVKAPPAPAPPAASPAPAAATEPPSPRALSGADLARAEDMFRRGETFLAQSNVAAARQFYRRAADMGLAQAALRLGATFDPAEIPLLRATGLAADPNEARSWYERARQLGAPEATSRLSRLANP
jgi:hypothetical protein